MSKNSYRAVAIAAVIGMVPAAFAEGLEGLKYLSQHTHTMKSEKVLTVLVGEMNGQKMAIIPMDDMHDLFLRAEGHSMPNP